MTEHNKEPSLDKLKLETLQILGEIALKVHLEENSDTLLAVQRELASVADLLSRIDTPNTDTAAEVDNTDDETVENAMEAEAAEAIESPGPRKYRLPEHIHDLADVAGITTPDEIDFQQFRDLALSITSAADQARPRTRNNHDRVVAVLMNSSIESAAESLGISVGTLKSWWQAVKGEFTNHNDSPTDQPEESASPDTVSEKSIEQPPKPVETSSAPAPNKPETKPIPRPTSRRFIPIEESLAEVKDRHLEFTRGIADVFELDESQATLLTEYFLPAWSVKKPSSKMAEVIDHIRSRLFASSTVKSALDEMEKRRRDNILAAFGYKTEDGSYVPDENQELFGKKMYISKKSMAKRHSVYLSAYDDIDTLLSIYKNSPSEEDISSIDNIDEVESIDNKEEERRDIAAEMKEVVDLAAQQLELSDDQKAILLYRSLRHSIRTEMSLPSIRDLAEEKGVDYVQTEWRKTRRAIYKKWSEERKGQDKLLLSRSQTEALRHMTDTTPQADPSMDNIGIHWVGDNVAEIEFIDALKALFEQSDK